MLGMLGLSKVQFIVFGVVLAALLGAGGLLWWQNRTLRADLATSQANNVILEAALEIQRGAVQAARANAEEWSQSFSRLQRTNEELKNAETKAQEEISRLGRLFARHDLAALANARPGLVERRVNDATSDLWSVLECTTSQGGCSPAGAGETAPAASDSGPSPPGSQTN